MSDKKLNCKNCKYKYCPFRGSDREISAFFCEDYEPKRRQKHERVDFCNRKTSAR